MYVVLIHGRSSVAHKTPTAIGPLTFAERAHEIREAARARGLRATFHMLHEQSGAEAMLDTLEPAAAPLLISDVAELAERVDALHTTIELGDAISVPRVTGLLGDVTRMLDRASNFLQDVPA